MSQVEKHYDKHSAIIFAGCFPCFFLLLPFDLATSMSTPLCKSEGLPLCHTPHLEGHHLTLPHINHCRIYMNLQIYEQINTYRHVYQNTCIAEFHTCTVSHSKPSHRTTYDLSAIHRPRQGGARPVKLLPMSANAPITSRCQQQTAGAQLLVVWSWVSCGSPADADG